MNSHPIRDKFVSVLIAIFSVLVFSSCGGGGGDAVMPPDQPSPGPNPLSLSRDSATLYTIDRASGGSLSNVTISLPGEIIQGGRGLATSPVTEELFAVLSVDDAANIMNMRRLLTSIEPVSGMATQIGVGQVGRGAALAFDNSGTLYSGESANTGAGFANRLYVLDTVTGQRTEFMPLANSEGGIALALNPLDGQIYHLSGSIIFGANVGTPVFEKIDTTSMMRTAIPLSGVDMGHVRAMSFGPDGNFLVVATYDQYGPDQSSGRFFRLTPDGLATLLGSMNHISKGVAFKPPVP
jgi:DNA-binding beta-propeller fold protein YncE